jgi:hypothetical protein
MMKSTITVILLSLLYTSAYASREEQKKIHIAACEGKQIGTSCSFEGRKGSVEGSCVEGKRNANVILCKDPNRKKKRRRNKQQ